MQLVKAKLEKTFLGSGATLIDDIELLDQFDTYALPSSPTYKSLTHYESASIVRDSLTQNGIMITDSLFAISRSFHQMYGSYQIATPKNDLSLRCSIIIRNSIDKSMSFKVSVGVVNMICSNGIMSSSIFASDKSSHSKNSDPFAITHNVISNYYPTFEKMAGKLKKLNTQYLTDYEARKLIMFANQNNAFPADQFTSIWQEYNKPSFPEFGDRTSYNMLMAITHHLKAIKTLSTLMNFYKNTALVFDL